MKTLVTIILFSLAFPAFAVIRPQTTYKGDGLNEEDEEFECTVNIGYVTVKNGKVVELSAKVGAHQMFHKDLKIVYSHDGITGYSNAPAEAFSGNHYDPNFFDYVSTFSRILFGATLNVELDDKGDLVSAEFFGNIVTNLGMKEYLCYLR